MSAAAAAPAESADGAPKKKSKKKLFILLGVAVLVLALAGVGGFVMLKKKHAAEEEADADAAEVTQKKAHAKPDAKNAPTFMPLDPFTVNLADREQERYLQVSMTLELPDPKSVDVLRAFMPAVRNNILMLLAHKTSAELLEREGKDKLAAQVSRETERALGMEPAEAEETDPAKAEAAAKAKKAKKKGAGAERLVTRVHFSSFIIQ